MTTYPNVPDAPGVPQVNRDPNAPNPDPAPAPLTADDPSVSNGSQSPQWGIFDQFGNDALDADSIISWRFIDSSKILDYPIEGGGFESYNKVIAPYEGWMVATRGGMVSERAAWLANLQDLKNSLDLLTVFTPEFQYPSANIKEYHLDRTREQGAGLITAEILVEEVRETVTANFTTTKNPASQNPTNAGPVQSQSVTTKQAAAIVDAPT